MSCFAAAERYVTATRRDAPGNRSNVPCRQWRRASQENEGSETWDWCAVVLIVARGVLIGCMSAEHDCARLRMADRRGGGAIRRAAGQRTARATFRTRGRRTALDSGSYRRNSVGGVMVFGFRKFNSRTSAFARQQQASADVTSKSPAHVFGQLIDQPIVDRMRRQFGVSISVRRTQISGDHGWVDVELVGSAKAVELALALAQRSGTAYWNLRTIRRGPPRGLRRRAATWSATRERYDGSGDQSGSNADNGRSDGPQ